VNNSTPETFTKMSMPSHYLLGSCTKRLVDYRNMAVPPEIAALFDLPQGTTELCSTSHCNLFVKYLEAFHGHLAKKKENQWKIDADEFGAFGDSLAFLSSSSPGGEGVVWHAEYGCALLIQKGGWASDTVSFNLIAPDGWRFVSTSKEVGDGFAYVDKAKPTTHQVLQIGICSLAKVEEIQTRFQKLMARASTRTGDKRSAAGGKQGHQMTPPFVHALYREAFGMEKGQQPRGGFTDVGLHTGGQKLDTAWPLVHASLHELLKNRLRHRFDVDDLAKKVEVYFGAFCSQTLINKFIGTTIKPTTNAPHVLLESAYRILQTTSTKAVKLSDDGVDMADFLALTKSLTSTIKKESSRSANQYSQIFVLPRTDEEVDGQLENHVIDVPPPFNPSKLGHLSEDELQQKITSNSGWVHVAENLNRLEDVFNWLKNGTLSDDTSRLNVLRAVESFVFELARDLQARLEELDCDRLVFVVDKYRDSLEGLKKTSCLEPLSRAVLKSRELLVVWTAFCVLHSNATRLHSAVMKGFGVPLHFEDLGHLVLPTKAEGDVVLAVASYLKNVGTDSPIFSLKSEESTFELGRRFADQSSELISIWKQEVDDANSRVQGHWEEVQRKQQLAAQLRNDIANLEVELANLQGLLVPKQHELAEHGNKERRANAHHASSYAVRSYDSVAHSVCRGEVNRLASQESSLENQLSTKKSQLEAALRAPAPVLQPLPEKQCNAMPIIFFLYMPKLFKQMSYYCLLSQQLLFPDSWNNAWSGHDGAARLDILSQVTRNPKVHSQELSWSEYYNSKQSSKYHTPPVKRSGKDTELVLFVTNSKALPKEVGNESVDHYFSDREGVWYPDSMRPRFAWFGGHKSYDRSKAGGREINPSIRLEHIVTVSAFTEQLGLEYRSLQWTMVQPGSSHIKKSRGNEGYARQRDRPPSYSKTEFLTLCNLRAFPHAQLRNVMVALQERRLPLRSSMVHALIQQTIFHVGTISELDKSLHFEWRQDLKDPHLCSDISSILRSLYDELKDCPTQYKTLALVAKLCNFFSKFNQPACRDTARHIAKSMMQWAVELEAEISSSPSGAIRAKQVKLYQHASLALVEGDLVEDDVAWLIQSNVKSRNLFIADEDCAEIATNWSCIEYGMSACLSEVLQIAERSGQMLTGAFQLVVNSCPDGLNWTRWQKGGSIQTQCFVSRDYGKTYLLNVMSGTVLINGSPPSQLPRSILDHPLYKRTFANRNFEVVEDGGFLVTCTPVFDRHYRFLELSGDLQVLEADPNTGETMELLGSAGDWTGTLPSRLRSMHSHWLLRDRNIVLVRGIGFNDRDVSFVIVTGTPDRGVKCVDKHLQQKNIEQLQNLLDEMDTLVICRSKAMDVLAKFEDRRFIHPLRNCQSQLRFFLPRYNLTFQSRNGALHCQEIVGYKLLPEQYVNGTFRGIMQYLVLGRDVGKSSKTVILFPQGVVRRVSHGAVCISTMEACSASLNYYQYIIHHRFGYFEAKQSRASRLQLAAIHLATSSSTPDENLGMTGEERAVNLLRASWTNRPLSAAESSALNNISSLADGLSPTISLLCHEITMCSKQLDFLHGHPSKDAPSLSPCLAGATYSNGVANRRVSSRVFLSRFEESRAGVSAAKHMPPAKFEQNIQLPKCRVSNEDLREIECLMEKLRQSRVLHIAAPTKSKIPQDEFPLGMIATSVASSRLGKDIIDELRESWDMYQLSTQTPPATVDGNTLTELLGLKAYVELRRKDAEKYIVRGLTDVHDHWYSPGHALLQLVGIVPAPTRADLCEMAVHPSKIDDFNPMLSPDTRVNLVESIIIWLSLCVYEDKVNRLISLYQAGNLEEYTLELAVKTVWRESGHPYWRIFEVENALQIRQEQYHVAQSLIHNQGQVMQLNMGKGKTRVILPMLVMFYSFKKSRDAVTRLHFLSALYEEAFGYFSNHLCASILRIKICSMPFCRDVALSAELIADMKFAIETCLLEGGAIVMAPEHRLSLLLKAKELAFEGQVELAALISNDLLGMKYRDILDECDEMLRHRYQLVYAIGQSAALPSGSSRWTAAQALLSAIVELQDILTSHPEACKLNKDAITGEWPSIQFYEGEALDAMLGKQAERRSPRRKGGGLMWELARTVMSNPPHELLWLVNHPLSDEIMQTICDEDYGVLISDLPKNHLQDVLMLRGLLAGGVLCHCLLKRHRVSFGVAQPGKKKLAVPFRAADTPDLRSEFAHPDCALVFTMLSYYHDGLVADEFHSTLACLMRQNRNAKHSIYDGWFLTSRDKIQSEDPSLLHSLDDVDKLDISNAVQVKLMHRLFCRNMLVVNYFLNNLVFNRETEQFDARLTATSWDLAANATGNVVGFSGTNDNHRILPGYVKQYIPGRNDTDGTLQDIAATNGRMLDVILKRTLEVYQLPSNQTIVDYICSSPQVLHAIIDCGALLAGVDLPMLSVNLLSSLPEDDVDGILFFDNEVRDWVILERSGRQYPKDLSPVEEDRVFAIFDEPRCRGTDLKLRADAVAVLTLGPNLCKDKLLQGAGRLRKLERSQNLVMVGGADVFTKMHELQSRRRMKAMKHPRQECNPTSLVLAWLVNNTVDTTASGLNNWANQGLFHCTISEKDPKLAVTDEKVQLEDMYGTQFGRKSVIESFDNIVEYHMSRTGGRELLSDKMASLVESISLQIKSYGRDFKFNVHGCDEECERELELEIEEEEEMEKEIPSVKPRDETDWEFSEVFNVDDPTSLPAIVGVSTLRKFLIKYVSPRSLANIDWSEHIVCTKNFVKSIVGNDVSLNSYLRVINGAVYFPNRMWLLVSDYELNEILREFWQRDSRDEAKCHQLLHINCVRCSLDEGTEMLLRCMPTYIAGSRRMSAYEIINNNTMASLQLFAGESMYATEERKKALKAVLRGKSGFDLCPKKAALELIDMRGMERLFPWSDLEALVEQLLCEVLKRD